MCNRGGRYGGCALCPLTAVKLTRVPVQGRDIPDVVQIIQYGTPRSLCSLVQRFGPCVRNPSLEGEALLLVKSGLLTTLRKASTASYGLDAEQSPHLPSNQDHRSDPSGVQPPPSDPPSRVPGDDSDSDICQDMFTV